MPGFNMEVPHALGKDEAKSRLQRFIDLMKRDYAEQAKGLVSEWREDTLSYSFSTFGMTISGDLTALEEIVAVKGSFPIAAMMFRGKIESTLRQQLERVLS